MGAFSPLSRESVMRRTGLPFLASCCLLLSAADASSQSPTAGPAKDPNIIILFADDLGYADLGCFGAKDIDTPNLDRMAREGVRLTSFYSAQAVCSASRAALLTGCYPNRIGLLGALGPAAKHGIHDDEVTLAELLKARGYATAIYGKWHLGHHPQFLPTRHGFDEYYGLPYSNDMWPHHPTTKFPDLPLMEGEKTIALNPDQTQLTKNCTDRALAFIAKNKDRPFFLYMPYSMPHVPLFASKAFLGKSKQGLYGDVVQEIDWSVGQILDALNRHGVDEKTLVIFTSDNGPWLSYGNHAGSAGPLREGKGTTWEGGVRVPYVARFPKVIPAGSVSHEPAMTIDLFPSIAALVGAELPKQKIDGLDLRPVLFGRPGAKAPDRLLLFYWGGELQAVRYGKWKLHFEHDYRALTGKPGRDGKPAGYSTQKTPLALYDLEADVGEKTDVARTHAAVVQQIQEKLEADGVRADLGDTRLKIQGAGVRKPGIL